MFVSNTASIDQDHHLQRLTLVSTMGKWKTLRKFLLACCCGIDTDKTSLEAYGDFNKGDPHDPRNQSLLITEKSGCRDTCNIESHGKVDEFRYEDTTLGAPSCENIEHVEVGNGHEAALAGNDEDDVQFFTHNDHMFQDRSYTRRVAAARNEDHSSIDEGATYDERSLNSVSPVTELTLKLPNMSLNSSSEDSTSTMIRNSSPPTVTEITKAFSSGSPETFSDEKTCTLTPIGSPPLTGNSAAQLANLMCSPHRINTPLKPSRQTVSLGAHVIATYSAKTLADNRDVVQSTAEFASAAASEDTIESFQEVITTTAGRYCSNESPPPTGISEAHFAELQRSPRRLPPLIPRRRTRFPRGNDYVTENVAKTSEDFRKPTTELIPATKAVSAAATHYNNDTVPNITTTNPGSSIIHRVRIPSLRDSPDEYWELICTLCDQLPPSYMKRFVSIGPNAQVTYLRTV